MLSDDHMLDLVNCSFQYLKMIDDIQLVGECYTGNLLDIIGVIDGKFMKAAPRYLDNSEIRRSPQLRDFVFDIIRRKEIEDIERINSDNQKKLKNAMTDAKSAWMFSIIACSLAALTTTIMSIIILSVKFRKLKRNKVDGKSDKRDSLSVSVDPTKLNIK
ncbi:hypothetical protein SNEBB_009094 [Seison nebaliae]|nr:hypothetical protein SNEBB_009094 [Seison nebaliae]